ncbi:MAG: methyltransferase domain-containing protein [Actinomycetota bacterium]|nr:methyltransferase domain-containing protein [Actinomycetota bacterium]
MTNQSARRAYAADALSWMAEVGALATELQAKGIPTLALSGPLLQQRLYGTPVAYPYDAAEVLIHPDDLRMVRRHLLAESWTCPEADGWIARLAPTERCSRRGADLDLRWGLAVGDLPSPVLAPLERALWHDARLAEHALMEPALPALVVYLALRAVTERFLPSARSDLDSATRQLSSRDEMWAVAEAARLVGTVRRAMAVIDGQLDHPVPLLDGWLGRLVGGGIWMASGRFMPEPVRAGGTWLGERLRRDATIHRRFAGLDLVVGRNVFPPTAISERLVDLALDAMASQPSPVVVDVGTGSGAVAIAVAHQRPDAQVHGVDVSPAAVRCARANARRLGVTNVRFYLGDLLEPVKHLRVDAVTTDAPYLPPGVTSGTLTRTMLDGGGFDGLDLFRRLASDAVGIVRPGGSMCFQVGSSQWEDFSAELAGMGYVVGPPVERRAGKSVVFRADISVKERTE